MPASRTAVNLWTAVAAVGLVSFPIALACSSGDGGGAVAGGPSTSGSSGNSSTTGGAATGGSNATGGIATTQGGAITGGATTGGATTGGTTSGGMAGAVGTGGTGGSGGTAGNTSAGTGGGSADPCDTPPWRKLNITAAVGEHIHGNAGLDTRAKTMLGKLVVDYGYMGGNGYSSFLGKRGYHSLGAPTFTECAAPDLDDGNRDRVSTCRLGEFTTTAAAIKTQLTMLQAKYPEEDWGYFLTQDGNNVRWEDVALTGLSHGATTAAVGGHTGACVWRVVSRSGPRDNLCGTNSNHLQCVAPLSTPNYDTNCPDTEIASWIDAPFKTPIERFYAIVGMGDDQCGDISFNIHRAKYLGDPTIYDKAGADFSNTHQFFASTQGHVDFLASPNVATNNAAVLEIAFGIPAENRSPAF